MFVSLQQFLEEWTWSSQDHLVCSQLLTILTDQSHISEVFVFFQISEGKCYIFLEVIPLETKLFWHVPWRTQMIWLNVLIRCGLVERQNGKIGNIFWGIGIGPDKECWPHGPSWRAGFLWEALKLCAEEYFANNKTSKGQRTKCREQLTNLRQSGDAAICPSSISFIVHWYSTVQWSTFQRCWDKGRKCEKVFTSNREDWTKLG